MIAQVQNEIYDDVYTTCSSSATVVKGNPDTAPAFPCITFKERENISHFDTWDTSGDTASELSYEINIFSNGDAPIAECASLATLVDSVMSGKYRMRRVFSDEVPNYRDTSIHRYLLRYQCVITKNGKIYRR